MPVAEVSPARHEALKGLRERLAARHRESSEAAFVSAEHLIPTGLSDLDGALGGGFPRGIIGTLEGPASSGRYTVAARLLAGATARGLGTLVQTPESGTLYPPALEGAGIALDRLVVVSAENATAVARAADIVLRSGAFGVVAIPTVPLRAAAWTRLASLAHRANALLVAIGAEPSLELRYFASLRVRLQFARIHWSGTNAMFATLAGYDVRAEVIKSKRASPGKRALVDCTTFETSGPKLTEVHGRALAPHEIAHADSLRPRSVVQG